MKCSRCGGRARLIPGRLGVVTIRIGDAKITVERVPVYRCSSCSRVDVKIRKTIRIR